MALDRLQDRVNVHFRIQIRGRFASVTFCACLQVNFHASQHAHAHAKINNLFTTETSSTQCVASNIHNFTTDKGLETSYHELLESSIADKQDRSYIYFVAMTIV